MDFNDHSWLAHPFAQFLYFHYLASIGMVPGIQAVKMPTSPINLSISQIGNFGFEPQHNPYESSYTITSNNQLSNGYSYSNPLLISNASFQNIQDPISNINELSKSFPQNKNNQPSSFTPNISNCMAKQRQYESIKLANTSKKSDQGKSLSYLQQNKQQEDFLSSRARSSKTEPKENKRQQRISQKTKIVEHLEQEDILEEEDAHTQKYGNTSQSNENNEVEEYEEYTTPRKKLMFYTTSSGEALAYRKCIVKAMLQKGIGVKQFMEYMEEHQLDTKVKNFYSNRERYQSTTTNIMTNVFRKIETFLQQNIKIVREENRFVSKIIPLMLNFKTSFSQENKDTLCKIMKSLYFSEKVVLDKNKIIKLYDFLRQKIDTQKQQALNKKKSKQPQTTKKQKICSKPTQFLSPKPKNSEVNNSVKKLRGLRGEQKSIWNINMDWELMQLFKFERDLGNIKKYFSNYYQEKPSSFNEKDIRKRIVFLFESALTKLRFFIEKYELKHFQSVPARCSKIIEEIPFSTKYSRVSHTLIKVYQQKEISQQNLMQFIQSINKQLQQFEEPGAQIASSSRKTNGTQQPTQRTTQKSSHDIYQQEQSQDHYIPKGQTQKQRNSLSLSIVQKLKQ